METEEDQMRLIVDVPKDIVDTLNSEEPLLSMKQESDLIDAVYEALQEAIEQINEDAISRRDMALNIVSFYNKATGKKKTLDFLCKCVEGLPPVQPMQRWIPVGERLPEEDGQYLITVKYKHVNDSYEDVYAEHGEWSDGGWDMFCFGHCGEVEDIIAWMPLPEPYKASPTETERSEKE